MLRLSARLRKNMETNVARALARGLHRRGAMHLESTARHQRLKNVLPLDVYLPRRLLTYKPSSKNSPPRQIPDRRRRVFISLASPKAALCRL